MLWTPYEITILVLATLATGVIGGAPLWLWVYSVPVPVRRPVSDHEDLAVQLEAAAELLREHGRSAG